MEKIEAKLIHLMDYHGDFTADDPKWKSQARLEPGAFRGASPDMEGKFMAQKAHAPNR